MTDEELMEVDVNSQEAAELFTTKDELLQGLIKGPRVNALAGPAGVKPLPEGRASIPDDDDLLL